MKATNVVLALLLVVPALLNFYTPLYNMVNPELYGLPFFWWFQIFLLALVVPFYLAFTFIEKRRDEQETVGGQAR